MSTLVSYVGVLGGSTEHVSGEPWPALVSVGDAALEGQAVGITAADRVGLVEVLLLRTDSVLRH